VKLFQIEEPEGGSADPDAPGAAIGIDAAGTEAQVAFSVGGNAVVLVDREGFERALPVPATTGAGDEWRQLLEAAKVRAERALARPVTHTVILLADVADAGIAQKVREAASEAGLGVLRLVTKSELPGGPEPALAAAALAEDLAPRTG
jgi:ribosomal protein L18